MRPGGTTLQAKANLPMRDSSCFLVHVRLWCRDWISDKSSCLRSCVMDACILCVSSKMPKKVIEVDGPSSFSCLVGALTLLQRERIRCILRWQQSEPGGPAVKKSSR